MAIGFFCQHVVWSVPWDKYCAAKARPRIDLSAHPFIVCSYTPPALDLSEINTNSCVWYYICLLNWKCNCAIHICLLKLNDNKDKAFRNWIAQDLSNIFQEYIRKHLIDILRFMSSFSFKGATSYINFQSLIYRIFLRIYRFSFRIFLFLV